jgi:Holliday junction resolvasome RuvABC endonuclease subunit
MSLAKLKKIKAHRVLGVDASTNSLAFCIMEDGVVISHGEIFFDGSDIYERVLDAKNKTKALSALGVFAADFMALEAGIVVKSTHVGIKMAYVFGVIMGEILDDSMKVIEVHPISWQSYIGNKNFTKAEKQAVKDEFPNKSENWYKAQIRKMRKQKTMDFAKSLGVDTDSDNVSDAVGIAWFAHKKMMDES